MEGLPDPYTLLLSCVSRINTISSFYRQHSMVKILFSIYYFIAVVILNKELICAKIENDELLLINTFVCGRAMNFGVGSYVYLQSDRFSDLHKELSLKPQYYSTANNQVADTVEKERACNGVINCTMEWRLFVHRSLKYKTNKISYFLFLCHSLL